MDLLKEFAPEFAEHQLDEMDLLFDKDKYQEIPKKYKLLTGNSAAVVLNTGTCKWMWVKLAKSARVTKDEITEAIIVARYKKHSVWNDTESNALGLLL